jgi:phospholipid/cholesterol/gamma-HCH transport system ATP-binding protein
MNGTRVFQREHLRSSTEQIASAVGPPGGIPANARRLQTLRLQRVAATAPGAEPGTGERRQLFAQFMATSVLCGFRSRVLRSPGTSVTRHGSSAEPAFLLARHAAFLGAQAVTRRANTCERDRDSLQPLPGRYLQGSKRTCVRRRCGRERLPPPCHCQSAAFDDAQAPGGESWRPQRPRRDEPKQQQQSAHETTARENKPRASERIPPTESPPPDKARLDRAHNNESSRHAGDGNEHGIVDTAPYGCRSSQPERRPDREAAPDDAAIQDNTNGTEDTVVEDASSVDAVGQAKSHVSPSIRESHRALITSPQRAAMSLVSGFATALAYVTSRLVDRALGPGTAASVQSFLSHDPSRLHPELADPSAAYEIEFEDVCKSFEARPVLKGLNLRIRRGEAVGIMGRSGCGKSTTLRLIAGFELPDSGSVRIRGWTRDEPIQYELGPIKIGMVFQHAALFDSLTVFENVAFELEHNTDLEDDEIEKAVDIILNRLGLRDTRDLLPNQLSGGMRKRVSLARSLVSDLGKGAKPLPDVLLYDEPTAGLDPIACTRIENLIREVRETVPTCIVVSHQLSTIQRTVDRVVLLHGGRIRWDGPVSDLGHTDNPFVRQLLSGDENGPMSGPEFDPDSSLYVPEDIQDA